MSDVITGPGIYQMRNGDFVAILTTDKHGNYDWQGTPWKSDGSYTFTQSGCDIIKRVADLPEVKDA